MDPELVNSLGLPHSPSNPTRRVLLLLAGAGFIGGGAATLVDQMAVDAKKKNGKKKKKKKGGKGGGKIKCSGNVVGAASAQEEATLLDLINEFRVNNGNPGNLTPQLQLKSAAIAHSRDMATRCYFDHVNPDGDDPFDRMVAAGYTGTPRSENIYVGSGPFRSASEAFEAWKTSTSGHREAMLAANSNQIGIGTALDGAGNMYWTNVFGQA